MSAPSGLPGIAVAIIVGVVLIPLILGKHWLTVGIILGLTIFIPILLIAFEKDKKE